MDSETDGFEKDCMLGIIMLHIPRRFGAIVHDRLENLVQCVTKCGILYEFCWMAVLVETIGTHLLGDNTVEVVGASLVTMEWGLCSRHMLLRTHVG